MIRLSFLLLLSLFVGQSIVIANEKQIWAAQFTHFRLNPKWGIWTDVHYRFSYDNATETNQFVFRPGIIHFFHPDLRLVVGYAYLNTNEIDKRSWKENRTWQQIQWNFHNDKIHYTQWLRTEQRFRTLETGENIFHTRARFNHLLNIGLFRNKTDKIGVVINEEIFLNTGGDKKYEVFDQNRFFAGINIKPKKNWNIQLGYMNIYKSTTTSNVYEPIHSLRLFSFINVDLQKS